MLGGRLAKTLVVLGVLGVVWRLALEPSAQADAPAPVSTQPRPEPVRIEVLPPVSWPDHRVGRETAAHATLLVETFLADLPEVVVGVHGIPQNAGLRHALPGPDDPWTVSVSVDMQGDEMAVELTLCGPTRSYCASHLEVGPRRTPNVPVGRVVAAVARDMGRLPLFASSVWSTPETTDAYATLMTGRAAASLYGWSEPVAPWERGNPRRDPVARAVYLDPGQASAWSIVGRTTEDVDRRVLAWRLASEARPKSAALRAGYAAALDAKGESKAAWRVWQEVAVLAPGDRRFVVAQAAAALAAGEPAEARMVLHGLGEQYDYFPDVARLDTYVADALGGASDVLLKRWQDADSDNAEPVDRRIERFVARREIANALSLTSELALRGRVQHAHELTVALASDLQRWGQAAHAAQQLGDQDLAKRLEARGVDDVDLKKLAALRDARSANARLAKAMVLHDLGRNAEAHKELKRVLREQPWRPEALHLVSEVLSALGQDRGASDARRRLLHADPLYFDSLQ